MWQLRYAWQVSTTECYPRPLVSFIDRGRRFVWRVSSCIANVCAVVCHLLGGGERYKASLPSFWIKRWTFQAPGDLWRQRRSVVRRQPSGNASGRRVIQCLQRYWGEEHAHDNNVRQILMVRGVIWRTLIDLGIAFCSEKCGFYHWGVRLWNAQNITQ